LVLQVGLLRLCFQQCNLLLGLPDCLLEHQDLPSLCSNLLLQLVDRLLESFVGLIGLLRLGP